MRKILFALLLFVAGIPQVMADKTSDYKEYAARVRAEVWADSLPQFIILLRCLTDSAMSLP